MTTPVHFDPCTTCHDEPLRSLPFFCWALREELRNRQLAPGDALGVFKVSVSVQCCRCHTAIPGEDLWLLGDESEAVSQDPRQRRLRLGYCLKSGCESYECTVILRNHPPFDWPAIVCGIQQRRESAQKSPASDRRLKDFLANLQHSSLARRITLWLAVLLLLGIYWQWHRGGTIPLLRQPEEFRVDPMPEPGPAAAPLQE